MGNSGILERMKTPKQIPENIWNTKIAEIAK
jgi:hypothetical protein